jgi:hypothetical protein
MALVLLKEIAKSKDMSLINYMDYKLLKRLYRLAVAKEGQNCLAVYNSQVDLAASSRFHYLLRECFTNWGSQFKSVNLNYISYTKKLMKRNLVPVQESKYWNFPDGVALPENLRGNSIKEDFSEDDKSGNGASSLSANRSVSPHKEPNTDRTSQVGEFIS